MGHTEDDAVQKKKKKKTSLIENASVESAKNFGIGLI